MNEDYSEYKLIAEFTAKDFQAVLNNAVKDGWVRAEPMNLATGDHRTIYSQLMGMPYDHQSKAAEPSKTKKEFINHDHN